MNADPAALPAEVDPRILAEAGATLDELGYPWRHLIRNTIVLPVQKVLFVPVPKAGWTSTLWLLAGVAGVEPATFAESASPEATPGLAIHDGARWPQEHRFGSYSAAERTAMLTDDTWLRFAVVRDPGARLWSAWQSKLLLREPRYAERFGDRSWFPRIPARAQDVIEDFRKFVRALPAPDAHDVHWARQHELTSLLPLTHIGRLEHLDETWTVLREHIGQELPRPQRENASLLSLPADAFDEESADIASRFYADDLSTFGYTPPAPAATSDTKWRRAVTPMLPAIGAIVARHEQIGRLSSLAVDRARQQREAAAEARQARQEAERLERRLTIRRKQAADPNSYIQNIEGIEDYDVEFNWEPPLERGLTAVIRAKNEATALPWVLPPLLRAVRRVVLVDNESTDGTPDVARETAERAGAGDRFEVHTYPFSVSRCGPEHLATPERSVHNLAYFYNWSFAHVRTTYALKWDADMVLTETGILGLQDVAWALEAAQFILTMPRYPLYVANAQTAFLDIGLINSEPWAWPNRPGYLMIKALEWELPNWPPGVTTWSLPDWSCVELKHLDEDEFAHWSVADFATSVRTKRKRREWEVYNVLAAGGETPLGVIRVDAPAGTHVIDYVRSTWLPAHKTQLGEELARVRPLLLEAFESDGRHAVPTA